jgi:hypothetical protein
MVEGHVVVAPNDLGIDEAGSSEDLQLLFRGHVQNPVARSVSSGRQMVANQYFRTRSEEWRELRVQSGGVALMPQFVDRLQ